MMTPEALKALAEDMARFRAEGSQICLSEGQADAIIGVLRHLQPEVGEIVNLPGLKRALELCDQSRAYFEVSARPLSAEHEWAVRVRLTSEIERLERLEIGQQLNNGQGRANQTRK